MNYLRTAVKTLTISAFIASSLHIVIKDKFFHKLDYYNEARVFNSKHPELRHTKLHDQSIRVVQNCPFNKTCEHEYKAFKSMFQKSK